MSNDPFDDFAALLRALAVTTSPPAPRGPDEHALAAAAAAYAAWRAITTSKATTDRAALVSEVAGLRRRCRAIEDQLAAARSTAPTFQSLSPRRR